MATKNFKWSEERHLFEMVKDMLDNHGDMADDVHICPTEGDYDGELECKVYCSAGYCLEIKKRKAQTCDYRDETAEDGWYYGFCEPWDGFKEAGYTGAVEVLSQYSNLKRK
jgi:hypothetical protein